VGRETVEEMEFVLDVDCEDVMVAVRFPVT
jgi:hypothetical protein